MGWPTLGLLHRCVTADGYAVQGVDMGSCPGLECVYEVGGGVQLPLCLEVEAVLSDGATWSQPGASIARPWRWRG